jgi:prepilin-type N-terminal cleavage/methylation domain-containing protein
MRQVSSSYRGFTLVEMVVVMVFAGVMLSLVAPRIGDSMRRGDVRAARNLVVSKHTTARATAVQRARATRFLFSGGNLVIRSQHPVTGATVTIGTPLSLYDHYGVTVSVIPATRDSVVFDARGLGIESGVTSIIISKNGYADTVQFSSMGRVLK